MGFGVVNNGGYFSRNTGERDQIEKGREGKVGSVDTRSTESHSGSIHLQNSAQLASSWFKFLSISNRLLADEIHSKAW